MTEGQLGDVILLETHDGKDLFFGGDEPNFKLLAYGNLGAPPTEYLTQKGYKQHGVNELDYLLQPRVVTVELWRSPACTRQEYWDNRLALHEFLRPNRGGPITFTLRTPNGDLRSLVVRADPGLVLPPAPDDNSWQVQEQLDFIAFDPVLFDSAGTVLALAESTQTQLVFPITFPIVFGSSDLYLTTGNITYTGTWKTYPTITLTGPYTRATVTNVTTGITFYMAVAILAGESRIIDLTPGAQSITDQDGVNRFGELGPGSNLIDFNLRPDPEVPNGIQEITIQLVDGVNGVSGAQIDYNNRYFAI